MADPNRASSSSAAPLSLVPNSGVRPAPPPAPDASRWYMLPGFGILVACLLLGEELKARFALILPGNILGLFILLALLASGLVPERWVAGAARGLLWLLPLLFVPIFVLALRDRIFWSARGPTLIAVMLVATVFLWAASGHLAQWLLTREKR